MGHENNGHRDYKRPLLNGKLYISGSETASANPGYMEAVVAAKISPPNFNKIRI
jgi:monoamine oxidase